VAALQEAGIPVSITLTDANIDAIAKAVSTALGQPVTLDQLRSTLASLTIQVGAVK
jgi:hypothetical protein